AAILLLALWLGGSRSGLETLLALGGRLGGGVLHIERIEGRLWGPLRLEGLSYWLPADPAAEEQDAIRLDTNQQDRGAADITLDRLNLDWELWNGALALRVRADGVQYRPRATETPTATASPGPLTLPEITLPLTLALDLEAVDIRLLGMNGDQQLDRLQLRSRIQGSLWEDLEVTLVRGEDQLALSGN